MSPAYLAPKAVPPLVHPSIMGPHAQDAAMPCLQSYGVGQPPCANYKVMLMEHLDGALDTVPWNANR